MSLKLVAASLLKPAEWNPRVVYDEEFRQLKESIRDDPDFLQERPILAKQDGTIYAGNMRYRALMALYEEGWESPWGTGRLVPVSIGDVSDHVAKARAVRDNVHAGQWQEIELAQLLTEIQEQGATVEHLGLRDDELKNVMAAAGIGEGVDPFTMRPVAPEGLSEAPGVRSGHSQGDPGTEGEGEPLTVVLTFSDIIALSDFLFRLESNPARWQEALGHIAYRGFGDHGDRIA